MSNYDFSTLSPFDFEELACDLLNAYYEKEHVNGDFRTFGPGRDKGIDLLLSTQKNNFEVIGQVKHYVKSTFSKLLRDLKNIEKDKVFLLDPKRYIIVTSQELTSDNKLKIKAAFEPYITTLGDIFGRQDLNNILSKNKNIEEKHFKLWFSSSIILNKILNYKFQGRNNEFTEVVLKRKIRLFVETNNFLKAKSILNNNKFIIITGEPGVGKSTLSDMMIYDFIKDDYELNIIYDDIKDVEINLQDNKSKQVFYFDDFLGHTQAEINKSKSAENSLLRIISRIENLDNKYLILNTRKFILTSFLDESERFRNFNPLRSEAKIELQSYSYDVKKRIIKNHIVESNLNSAQIDVINNLAGKLCSHDNFTPRIIEFFTGTKVVDLNSTEYEKFILENIENPKEIWNHAYSFQINDYERFLLNTLYSKESEMVKEKLESAYNHRLNYEVLNNNFIKPINSFRDSLRRLNDGFIVINQRLIDFESNETLAMVGFINPSLEDFLKYYINKNHSEIERILMSSKNIKQWYFFFKPYIFIKKSITGRLIDHLRKHGNDFISDQDFNNDLYLTSIFDYYFNSQNGVPLADSFLFQITNWQFLKDNDSTHFYSKKFLNEIKSNLKLNKIISDFNQDFFIYSLLNERNLDEFLDLFKLFKKHFNINIRVLNCNILLFDHTQNLFNQKVNENYYFLEKINTEKDYHLEIVKQLKENKEYIQNLIFTSFDIEIEYFINKNWNHNASINLMEEQMNPSTAKRIDDYDSYADEVIRDYENFYYDDHENLDDIINDELEKRKNSSISNGIDFEDELPF
mgnify:CR=1 FL=1|tara:strand:- start:304 stop:2709 length:2406 start_codon:yes stop_codon:yes gene_type:complete